MNFVKRSARGVGTSVNIIIIMELCAYVLISDIKDNLVNL